MGAQETTQPLSPEQLDELQDHIDNILQENTGNPSYDCFRSYFFVLDMRGIKVPTSSDNTASKAPWDSLVSNYPMLDWRYMEDPESGELLIDIGFGFHPPPDTPLVGFWRSDVLRLGFDYGGYAQGTNHSECTIPAIGGINAEMPKARRLRVHIAYRQAYNLAFETIRGKLTREGTGYFSAESAYHEKEDYAKNIRQMKEAFSRNCTRSYGVRDEYRCRVTAIRLLSSLVEKVGPQITAVLYLKTNQWEGPAVSRGNGPNPMDPKPSMVYLSKATGSRTWRRSGNPFAHEESTHKLWTPHIDPHPHASTHRDHPSQQG